MLHNHKYINILILNENKSLYIYETSEELIILNLIETK